MKKVNIREDIALTELASYLQTSEEVIKPIIEAALEANWNEFELSSGDQFDFVEYFEEEALYTIADYLIDNAPDMGIKLSDRDPIACLIEYLHFNTSIDLSGSEKIEVKLEYIDGADKLRDIVKWLDGRNEHLNQGKSHLDLIAEYNNR